MNIEQERADFETWYKHHHGDRDVYALDEFGEYVDKQVQGAFNVWQARAALHAQDREDAKEIAATLATALHFIPRSEEPELYDDIDALCVQFSNHARNIVGEKDAISMD